MTVRPFTAADFPAVCRIYRDARLAELAFEPGNFTITPLEEDPTLRQAFDESDVLVFDDGGVLGFAATWGGHLRALFVADGARGNGVGAKLLDAVRTPGMSLHVAHSNAGARRFYARHGFVVAGQTVRPYGGHEVTYDRMTLAAAAAEGSGQ
ncbi:GNAT family N-acetyltransferase [Massilia sp. METH4]|uniref:GNAT family N-acetyltransferase n=1 Tax=Massilia sp. METH4 TaxID=3123041 RepID=UPI0030CCD1FE